MATPEADETSRREYVRQRRTRIETSAGNGARLGHFAGN